MTATPPVPPTLTDGRLVLRPLENADRDALYAAVIESKDDVGRWMSWRKPDYSINTGLNQFNRIHHFANLGYWVRTSRVPNGIASSAVRMVARYGFDHLGLARIEIVAQVPSAASRRVAEKAGCRLEGIARSRIAFGDWHFDAALYSLLPEDLAPA